MKTLTKVLVAKLMLAGVVAGVEFIPGADGGFIVRVGRLAHVEPAEKVAEEIKANFGVEVLVAF